MKPNLSNSLQKHKTFLKAVLNVVKGIAAIVTSIADGIVKIATPETALGILALAGAFYLLSSAVGMLGAMGLYAIPAMLGLLAFTAGIAALGFSTENIIRLIHGPGDSGKSGTDEKSQMELDIGEMKVAMNALVVGFGGDPKSENSNVIADNVASIQAVYIKSL